MSNIFTSPTVHDGVIVMRDVKVPMRDGVELATDIYLPASCAGREHETFPVIMERTPYGKHLPSRSEREPGDSEPLARSEVAAFFVRHGYAVVYQDCRGRYGSGGGFTKYTNDAEDGYDTCAWILAQPWSNGRIGTKGLSYAAHTQTALGSVNAPGVVAMMIDSGGFSNAYQNGIRQGGAFEMKQVTWAVSHALESESVRSDPEKRRDLTLTSLSEWFRIVNEWTPGHSPMSAAPEYESYVFEQWRNGTFNDYWRRPGLYAEGYYASFCKAATVHMSSWYDPYSRSACDNYLGLAAAGRGPASLILGPWTHGNRFLTFAGDVDFGNGATLHGNLAKNYLELRLRWFERYLKNADDDTVGLAPVQLFVMGGGSGRKNAAGRRDHGGCWRTEQIWPIVRTEHTAFYFHPYGSLSAAMPVAAAAHRSYDYDPANPVPTNGGAVTSGEPWMSGGAFDQGATGQRPDVLSFQTAPLEEDVEVTGSISATLWVSSDCLDTDFTFKLIDVAPPNEDYPNGYAMNLTDGILRMRYRDSWEQPKLMEPGLRYQVVIDALPTSNVFQRGHAIRVDIASSNFPKFDCNPNSGGAEGFAGPVKVARNTVYMDVSGPSHIVLPIVPSRSAPSNSGAAVPSSTTRTV